MHADLLRQAYDLATRDPRKPKQVNLRRAVSAAYYSMFHLLVDQACRVILGARHEQSSYRNVLGRAFSHSTMKSACASFAGGTLKASVAKGLPTSFAAPVAISNFAELFVVAQLSRHTADYDLGETYSRSDVLKLIEEIERATADFLALPSSDERSFFLACLLTWDSLAKR